MKKPQTVYRVFVGDQAAAVASFKPNTMGIANAAAIGPIREVAGLRAKANPAVSRIVVVEGEGQMDAAKAVLRSPM